MSMFKKLFGRTKHREDAEVLYEKVVERTRTPLFYEKYGVADTVEGRFELLTLHAFLVLRRLKRDGAASAELAQETFDVMFENVDLNLREVGVGDIGLARRIKKMAEGFYGRVEAYDQALERGDENALEKALGRNLYNGTEPGEEWLEGMSSYMRECDRVLAGLSRKELVSKGAIFAAFPK